MPEHSRLPRSPLPNEVLVLGGYGNFGKRIARGLNRHGVPVVVAGRDADKAAALAAELGARSLAFDVRHDLPDVLRRERPSVVVHTAGPFQGADYGVARACIAAGVAYVDLADGRDFVRDFAVLDAEAKAAGVTLVSGASTVPGLSSAVIEHLRPAFSRLDAIDFGISPGQRTERGLATFRAILSYAGRRLRPFPGRAAPFGWLDLHSQVYPVFGRRWLSACDIPDLDLLPAAYGFKAIRFGAGIEVAPLMFVMAALAWLIKAGLPLDLPRLAPLLKGATDLFNPFGSDTGGMHVTLTGEDHEGRPLETRWFIVAGNGDGPQIPCVPGILLAKRLHEKDPGLGTDVLVPGAFACVGLIKLEDYLAELKPYAVTTY